jgi:hypothetical protein
MTPLPRFRSPAAAAVPGEQMDIHDQWLGKSNETSDNSVITPDLSSPGIFP